MAVLMADLAAAGVVLGLAAVAWLLGRLLWSAVVPGRPASWSLALVSGLLAFYALLLAFDLAGWPWRRLPLAGGVAALAALLAAVARRRSAGPRPAAAPGPGPPGWGDAVGAGAAALFAWAAWRLRIVFPDFVYHWGIKAKRFWIAGGVDYPFLADPLRLTDHPDYPHLLPGIFAATAEALGRFDERSMVLWSAVLFGALLGAGREALGRAGLARPARQGAVALLGLATGTFAIGYLLAGSADWFPALAVVVALPALLAPAVYDPRLAAAEDLRVGIAAALAAAGKIEGVGLATLLVAVHLSRTVPGLARTSHHASAAAAAGLAGWGGRLGRLLVPPAAVVSPWAFQALRHDLFSEDNAGGLVLQRLPAVAGAALESFTVEEWHGLPWLLALLPVTLLARRTRAAAAVLALQAGLYLVLYLVSPLEPGFLVASSLPRLLFHLLPAFLVVLAVWLSPRPSLETGLSRTG